MRVDVYLLLDLGYKGLERTRGSKQQGVYENKGFKGTIGLGKQGLEGNKV